MRQAEFEDFTEKAYCDILAAAHQHYAFEHYGTRTSAAHVLWRHDVDYSVHRAAALARIEAERHIQATYFVLLHSELYNLLELDVARRVREIVGLGHWLGLHFDAGFYGGFSSQDALAEKLQMEARLLEDVFEQPVRVFSLHNTDVSNSARFDAPEIAGLINASGRAIKAKYRYVSDSNGYWRFDRLADVVASGADRRLHVLTHPEWWQEKPMSPRARITRCLDGRSRFHSESYDRLLATYGRRNIR